MFTADTQIRIHYALTDQMGVVYHGHYAQFYEIGRAEWLRKLNYSYKDIEAMGVIMPVVDIHSRFLRPAKYEDLITVRTTLKEMPLHHKIVFHHEIYNEQGTLLNTGDVTLYFMNAKDMKRCEIPAILKEKLAGYFETGQ
ncbi:MAG: acyl-CoA thioesterase [Chitinophagaceae bacterium]|nr:acyl-CoA thioesterase [Chitinophagaceae bacterium]